MKVKNGDIVRFVNYANGIMEKKIPMKLYNAIDLNMAALEPAIKTYTKQYEACVSGERDQEQKGKEIDELLAIEVEAVIQTVPRSVMFQIDAMEKFDALTGREYQAIGFMTGK